MDNNNLTANSPKTDASNYDALGTPLASTCQKELPSSQEVRFMQLKPHVRDCV